MKLAEKLKEEAGDAQNVGLQVSGKDGKAAKKMKEHQPHKENKQVRYIPLSGRVSAWIHIAFFSVASLWKAKVVFLCHGCHGS